jgi:1A family penicillin-binding protein
MAKKSKLRRFFYFATAAAVSTAAVAFGLWSASLFRRLELVTQQRALRQPARFFADAPALRRGMALTLGELARRLEERGYEADTAPPSAEGRYARLDGETLEAFLRPFPFPGGPSPEGTHRFHFRDGLLERLEDGSGRSLGQILLEPLPLDEVSRGGAESRPWIELDDIPPLLKLAVIVAEDRRFFQHHGLDLRSLARAAWVNVRSGRLRQGGSTLTQQLVKNAFLTQERTLRRKITEAGLAVAMEARFDKDAILEMYLNQIYLGQSGLRAVYGVEDAARSYFGRPVSELTRGECALLAGIIPAPSLHNPRASPENALRRRRLVLDLLLGQDLITEEERKAALREPLVLAPLESRPSGAYYLAHAREILEKEFGAFLLDNQGYRIYTAMDDSWQKAAERALAGQELEGAVVALDPRTGFVRALAGGRDFAASQFNRAVRARRQPGSAFKPVLYAAALESRALTLASLLPDEPYKIVEGTRTWEPRNYDGRFRGTVTVREALANSINVPAVHALRKTGTAPVLALARSLGLPADLPAVPSLALGAGEVTPLELTAAYAAFANGGRAVEPIFVRWVTDAEGRVAVERSPSPRPVLSPEAAALITDVLRDVLETGTARSARLLGFAAPAAGKTGTSNDYADAWFVGYTPEVLCGVWLGHDRPASLGRAASALALPVWVNFMKAVLGPGPWPDFEKERGLKEITIDPASGLRARAGCLDRRKEFFLPGTEPAEACPLHEGGAKGLLKRMLKWFREK